MREGPESDLVLTENAQPALMAVSVAVVRILEKDGGKPLLDAGVATSPAIRSANIRRWRRPARCKLADARPAAEAARPVDAEGGAGRRRRHGGAARHRARTGAGGLQGGGAGRGRRAVANDNGGGQVVVSGHKAAVERAIEAAKPRGSKRGMLLPVSAPFHCPLMQPAADAMQEALEEVTLVDAARAAGRQRARPSEITNPADIKQRLVEQVTGMVRWRESVQYMKTAEVDSAGRMRHGQGAVGPGQAHRQGDDRPWRSTRRPTSKPS